MSNDENLSSSDKDDKISFSEFLEKIPPGKTVPIKFGDYVAKRSTELNFNLPRIKIYCNSADCNRFQFFENRYYKKELETKINKYAFQYLFYICKNCQITEKTFAVRILLSENEEEGTALKFGEFPPFGPPTPPKLLKLIDPDREFFLLGRRCENQGLGIGALVYYRRVVENQKNRILREIKKVAKKLRAKDGLIKEIDEAIEENQFSKAINSIKEGIPEPLLFDGHNPLKILHRALSVGVHNKSDEECLNIAQSIRIVLSELATRLAQTLKDESELKSAISKLMKNK